MDEEDERRFDLLVRRLVAAKGCREMFTTQRGVTDSALAALERHCRVDHAAILLFPRRTADLSGVLRSRGFEIVRTCPSTVVRARLAGRYRLDPASLPVQIVHAARDGAAIEVFALPREDRTAIDAVVAGERARDDESHLALQVLRPDEVVILGIARLLTSLLGFAADGGGFNPHEDAEHGGRTVLYLRRPRAGWPRRVELACAGRHPSTLRLWEARTDG
ncbi:hypothetical protein ITP53_28445 [Nonomuraea sp. K274]|uniref:Uncharacterized protein n=1 Tax=Nonomuraea cypriaca TaxID=1187855 RepID=A0A931AAY0_9ACTN|nr:hypothetical protein [Nonomuraea cypriaca]MBF8189597.1 hypothetical protein [Nonomuraea cypriaca]